MTGRERRRAAGEVGAVEHNPETTVITVTTTGHSLSRDRRGALVGAELRTGGLMLMRGRDRW